MFLGRIILINPVKVRIFNNFAKLLHTESAKTHNIPTNLLRTSTILNNNSWIYQGNNHIKTPDISIIRNGIIEFPRGINFVIPLEDPKTNSNEVIEAPAINDAETPKEAARLIVIRRKKMKKHKLKKLRKRMKFEWAKRRQRREWRKEKEFQAVLIQSCKEAEAFSAEAYVSEKLKKVNEELPIPNPFGCPPELLLKKINSKKKYEAIQKRKKERYQKC